MKMDYEALFWGHIFISSLLCCTFFFFFVFIFYCLFRLWRNRMSTRIILNNVIVFICKYAKM